MSDKSIKPPTTSNNSLSVPLNHNRDTIWVTFVGSCLREDKFTYTNQTVVKIYIVYKINLWALQQSADFRLGNPLFGAVKPTKNAGFNKSVHPFVYSIVYTTFFII